MHRNLLFIIIAFHSQKSMIFPKLIHRSVCKSNISKTRVSLFNIDIYGRIGTELLDEQARVLRVILKNFYRIKGIF